MTVVVPNVGEILVFKNYLNNTAPQDQKLKLYTNDITPDEGDTAGIYTEATFTGYSAAALAGANWNFTSGNPSFATYSSTLTFTSSAPQTLEAIYGFYVVQTTSELLMWAERFDTGPFNIRLNGDNIQITLKIAVNGC